MTKTKSHSIHLLNEMNYFIYKWTRVLVVSFQIILIKINRKTIVLVLYSHLHKKTIITDV